MTSLLQTWRITFQCQNQCQEEQVRTRPLRQKAIWIMNMTWSRTIAGSRFRVTVASRWKDRITRGQLQPKEVWRRRLLSRSSSTESDSINLWLSISNKKKSSMVTKIVNSPRLLYHLLLQPRLWSTTRWGWRILCLHHHPRICQHTQTSSTSTSISFRQMNPMDETKPSAHLRTSLKC